MSLQILVIFEEVKVSFQPSHSVDDYYWNIICIYLTSGMLWLTSLSPQLEKISLIKLQM